MDIVHLIITIYKMSSQDSIKQVSKTAAVCCAECGSDDTVTDVACVDYILRPLCFECEERFCNRIRRLDKGAEIMTSSNGLAVRICQDCHERPVTCCVEASHNYVYLVCDLCRCNPRHKGPAKSVAECTAASK